VAKIAKQKPAAVVLDIMMPDYSGLDVLNFLKADRSLSEIPVIIVSAKSLPDEIHEGLDAGANAYLTKPVAFTDLKRAIEEVISISEGRE
jgi:DNA-binding response OmpR family regulator